MDCKEIKPVNPKEISPEYSLEGLKLKLQYFGHLMQRTDSLAKTLMLEKIEGKREAEDERLDSITNSIDMNLRKLLETVSDFILGAAKSLQMVIATMKLKGACFLEEKL